MLMTRDQVTADFGRVWDAAGLRNFYGQGWRHSWFLQMLGLDLSGSTFVSKTTTVDPRPGNTPLREDLMTVDVVPRSVYWQFWGCHTLNAWGLSGPGAEVVLDRLAEMCEQEAFKVLQISFMPVGDRPNDLLGQTRRFTAMLLLRKQRFRGTKLIVQFNASCPNTGYNPGDFLRLITEHLKILSELGLPVMVKESLDTPFNSLRRALEQPNCVGLVTTNSVKFGNMADKIPWESIFGSSESPLKDLGGGGYSGPYLLPLVEARVRQYRQSGYAGHINAGGGIRTPADARLLHEAGADSVFIGATCANYRPWNAAKIVAEARSWH